MSIKSIECDLRFPESCRIGLLGSTNSGKSFLACKLILQIHRLFIKVPKEIHIFFRIFQPIYEKISSESTIKVVFHKELEEIETVSKLKHIGVFFDDLDISVFGNEFVQQMVTISAHHNHYSFFMFSTQNIFENLRWQIRINRNLSYFIILNSVRMESIVSKLNQSFYPGSRDLVYAYRAAVQAPKSFENSLSLTSATGGTRRYSYLVVNLEAESDFLSFYSNIFLDEHLCLFLYKSHYEGE